MIFPDIPLNTVRTMQNNKPFTTTLFLVLWLGLVLGAMQWVQAQREPIPTQPDRVERPVVVGDTSSDIGEAGGKGMAKKRIREGTTLKDKRVFFRQTGIRTTMYTVDENDRFTCLENLNLQRILAAIEEKPERSIWKIDATFTEFMNENYVLITRAIVAPDDYMPSTNAQPVTAGRSSSEANQTPAKTLAPPPSNQP